MRTLLLAVLLMLAAQAAQAQLTLCNRTNRPVEVATVAESDIMAPVVDGWKPIAPGACEKMNTNMAVDYAYYARQTNGGKVWDGGSGGPRLCVVSKPGPFSVYYHDLDDELLEADTFRCESSGEEKRSFIKLPNPNGNNYTVDLR
jgi:uncharacterized membrane protein